MSPESPIVLPTKICESMMSPATSDTFRNRTVAWSLILQQGQTSRVTLAQHMFWDNDQGYMLPLHRTKFSHNNEHSPPVSIGVADAYCIARDFEINKKKINTEGYPGLFVVLFSSGFSTGIDLNSEETTVLQALTSSPLVYPGVVYLDKLSVFQEDISKEKKDKIKENIKRIHGSFLRKVANLKLRGSNNYLYEFKTTRGQSATIEEMFVAVSKGKLYIPIPDEEAIKDHHVAVIRNSSM